MPSSLLPDLARRSVSVVIIRLSEALLSESSQNPPGGGRLMEAPPMFACAASALEAEAARTSATKVRRQSMASPVVGGIPCRTERLDCAKSMAGSAFRADQAKAVEREVRGDIREYHFDAPTDRDRSV